ncbi:MAG TPA: hypothetical protein VFK38_06080 [Candidatus Limnocylindrales bacterium]|nr:hypothetical protein [Candidatus Limnocylindrales bacterium]
MPIFKFLHIATMFMAVALALGPALLLHRVAPDADVRLVRGLFGAADRLGRFIPLLFTAGLVFGLITAWTGRFDFFAPWLLIAYALFIVASITGAGFTAPWIKRVAALAESSPDGPATGELAAALADRRAHALFWLDVVIIVGFVFDMVVKPFS